MTYHHPDGTPATVRVVSPLGGDAGSIMDLKALIEKQRAQLNDLPFKFGKIAIGGEQVEIAIRKLIPNDWQLLVAEHFPRPTSEGDVKAGYDQHSLPRDYPVDSILVGDEEVDKETWQELYDVLDSPFKNTIGALMFQVNVLDPLTGILPAGKAGAGKRSGSPANRASRRAATKGGNPQK